MLQLLSKNVIFSHLNIYPKLDSVSTAILENDFLVRLRQRDEKALKQLYDKYAHALMGVIFRIVQSHETSEDILQEAFVKIWQNIDSYDENKGRLFTWMMNISRNLAIDKVRSPKFSAANKIQDIEDFVYKIDLAQQVHLQPDHIGLKQVVETLKQEQKEVIDLVYFYGYSHSEAAERLAIPLGTVKTRIRSAMIELRRFFK